MASPSEIEDDPTSFVDVDKLLALVQGNPAIYNTSLKEHHSINVIGKIWSDIGNELGVSGAICKTKWSNLRNSYARYVRDLKKMPSGSAKKQKKWHLAEAIDFLQPWTGSYRKISSCLSPSETQDSEVPPAATSNDDQVVTQTSSAQTPTESAIESDVSAGIFGGEYVPKKRNTKTPAEMVAAPMIDFLKAATESRKLDANKTTENPMLSYFKSLLPDTDVLTDGRKRRFKIKVMEVLSKLIEEQENEHFVFSRPTSTSSSSYDHTTQPQGNLFPGAQTVTPFNHSNEGPLLKETSSPVYSL